MFTFQSPFGAVVFQTEGDALSGLSLQEDANLTEVFAAKSSPLAKEAAQQLSEYFARRRKTFSLPLSYTGTAFQQAVWQALLTIPYGETRTYGEIAAQIGSPKAARAVGGACHANPLWIVIPCHRVVGASGGLTGFGGGLTMKQALLALEKAKDSR